MRMGGECLRLGISLYDVARSIVFSVLKSCITVKRGEQNYEILFKYLPSPLISL